MMGWRELQQGVCAGGAQAGRGLQASPGRAREAARAGLASSRAPGGWTPAGTHTPTCHTFLLSSAFSHARSWHSRLCHAGTCHPDPRKVGEAFLWAWRQGPLQVKTRPGGGDAGLQHQLSSCGRPSPAHAWHVSQPVCPPWHPPPRWRGCREHGWAAGGRFPPFFEWDPGPGAKALSLSGPVSPPLRLGIQLIQRSELGHLCACMALSALSEPRARLACAPGGCG